MITWKLVLLIVIVVFEVINLFMADHARRRAFRKGYSRGYEAGTERKVQFSNMMKNTDLTNHNAKEESYKGSFLFSLSLF